MSNHHFGSDLLEHHGPIRATDPPAATQVLIVGSGPTGLLISYLFAKQEVRCAIIEKHVSRLGQPKAHALNPRSLEIFRQAGIDVRSLRSQGASASDAFWVSWVSSLPGVELCRLPYERQDDPVLDLTPEPLFNIAQPKLEEVLERVAMSTGLVSIHRGWLWEDVAWDTGDKPLSQVRDLVLPDAHLSSPRTISIRSEYIIGADGTDSTVRGRMDGIRFETPPGVEVPQNYYRSIHCRGDLSAALRPSVSRGELYFCVHPEHPAGIIVYDLQSSFVHVTVVPDGPESQSRPITEQESLSIVQRCVPTTDISIQSVTVWKTWPRVANEYRNENTKMFLIGDAAHSFPPQGGLGVNTGVADAHNLAWKLTLALKTNLGDPERLLWSYSAERRPVAVANALQSAENERVGRQANSTLSHLVKLGESSERPLGDFIEEKDVRAEINRLAEMNKPHFDSLALQLGYVYGQGDGTKLLDDVSMFLPSVVPGARLPHAWLPGGKSTLDWIPCDKFVVLFRGTAFSRELYNEETRLMEGLLLEALDVDMFSPPEDWCRLIGVFEQNLGILVRPDQHILGFPRSMEDAERQVRQYLEGN